MNSLLYEDIIKRALAEDIGFEDLTTAATVSPEHMSSAKLLVKQQGVIAGMEIAAATFRLLDPSLIFKPLIEDGSMVEPGQLLATVEGKTAPLLTGERTALNLLQRLSGIATEVRRAVEAVKGFSCTIVDTRKTTPGLRVLEKYAVRTGGGRNHRFGLFDAALIKDNHIAAAGGIGRAVALVRERSGHTVKIEVETENLVQVQEALDAKADIIMLDNMTLQQMSEAVKLIGGRCPTEASGGITLDKLREVAATGVSLISLGAVTHSVKALDISLNIADKERNF